jgi:hypothetical protein
MKTVKLKLMDRFAALEALPQKGTYVQMQIAKGLSDVLNMKAEEIEAKELKAEGNSLHWNTEKDVAEPFELSEIEFDAVVAGLKRLDKEEKLEPRHMHAFEVFVNGQ